MNDLLKLQINTNVTNDFISNDLERNHNQYQIHLG